MAKKRKYQSHKRPTPLQNSFFFLSHEKKELEAHYNFLKCQIKAPNNGKRLLKVIGYYNQTGVNYVYEITYDGYIAPNVKILSPSLAKDTPHIYNNSTLCLFYPKKQPWSNKTCHIFSHTIPWIHEWILFYEIWKISGVWEHPEVTHRTHQKDK